MPYGNTDTSWGTLIFYGIVIILHAMVASGGGCAVEKSRFHNALRNEGLEDGVQGGYDFFECGYGDLWVSSFTAKRPVPGGAIATRITVPGTVCCGISKGCTIRWE